MHGKGKKPRRQQSHKLANSESFTTFAVLQVIESDFIGSQTRIEGYFHIVASARNILV